MQRFRVVPLLAVISLMLWSVSAAVAHDMDVTTSFDDDWTAQEFGHNDEDPWKGWANITVSNTGTESWGDFHFEIVGTGIENVDFLVASPNEPTYDKGSGSLPLTWSVNNSVVGATLDLYFYSNPVAPSETATFTVYTDNTVDQNSFFGLMLYPTPVPEPTALAMLAMGGLMLLRRSKR